MADDYHQPARTLNRAFAADPAAVRALMVNHVPCNRTLADDPTVVVDCDPHLGHLLDPADDSPGHTTVSALGLINGILGDLGMPLVATRWGEPAEGRTARQFLGFAVYEPPNMPAEESRDG